jgi:hypothetical protein
MAKKRNPLQSKRVPYWPSSTALEVRRFLPERYQAPLRLEDVQRFVRETRKRPEVRLAVLGVLRANSTNGAEALLAGVGVLFTAFAIIVAVAVPGPEDWIMTGLWLVLAAALVFVALSFVRVSFAVHARRITSMVWLSAYEDAVRQERRGWTVR